MNEAARKGSLGGGTRRRLLFVMVGLAIMTFVPPNTSAGAKTQARLGADWLVRQQDENGAFFSSTQDPDLTAATLAAIVSGGVTNDPVTRALGYIEENGEARAREGAIYAGRIVAGVVAGGADPRNLGGTDYVQILASRYDAASGSYDDLSLQADLIAANGGLAAKGDLPAQATKYIRSNQCKDGQTRSGFADVDCALGLDVDTTAWAINVLIAAGAHLSDGAIVGARRFLAAAQNDDGGFGHTVGQATRADSTGLALSAIYALREDPRGGGWTRPGGNPVRALKGLQDASGGFRTSASDTEPSGPSTVSAIPGMAGSTYPIPPKPPVPPPTAGSGGGENNGGGGDTASSGGGAGAPGANPGGGSSSQDSPGGGIVAESRGSQRAASGAEASRDKREAFSRPKVTYSDPGSRTPRIALAGLAVSLAMMASGVALLRGSRL